MCVEKSIKENIKEVIELTDFEMMGSLAICVSATSVSRLNTEECLCLDFDSIANRQLKIYSKKGIEIIISFSEVKTFSCGQSIPPNKQVENKSQSIFIII